MNVKGFQLCVNLEGSFNSFKINFSFNINLASQLKLFLGVSIKTKYLPHSLNYNELYFHLDLKKNLSGIIKITL